MAQDEELKQLLFPEKDKEHIIFSCKVEKMNRWDLKKNVILTLSNFGQISIISEEKKVHFILKLSDLKSLTWVEESQSGRQEIVLNHMTLYDYRLDCMDN